MSALQRSQDALTPAIPRLRTRGASVLSEGPAAGGRPERAVPAAARREQSVARRGLPAPLPTFHGAAASTGPLPETFPRDTDA